MFYPRILFNFSDGSVVGHHYCDRTIADIHADILFYLEIDAEVEWHFMT